MTTGLVARAAATRPGSRTFALRSGELPALRATGDPRGGSDDLFDQSLDVFALLRPAVIATTV